MPVKYSQRKSAREQRKLAGEPRKSAIENVKVTVPERSLFPVDFSQTCMQPQNLTIKITKKLRSRVHKKTSADLCKIQPMKNIPF